jgi:hypothetical protein
LLVAASVNAQTALPVSAASPSQLKIDGDVGEWRGARFVRVGEGAAGSAEVALAYDSRGLYVGARVKDDKFVRSDKPSSAEDALVVRLAFPARSGFIESELWLFAGRIGETRASAQLRKGSALAALGSAQIIEGPSPGGYALEAFAPWTSFEGGADWSFARGALRLHDVDARGGAARDAATAAPTLTAATLPWLALDGGPVAALANFLRAKNLDAASSKLDFVGDLRGDARAERVLVIGTAVAVSGNGTQFTFAELPVRTAGDVLSAELRDLTGDGKPELALRLRQQNELGTRELWKLYGFASETPASIFGVELRKETSAGFVTANLKIERGARGVQLVVTSGKVDPRLTAESWSETPASGEDVPIPLPWGSWRERSYAWNGSRFAVVHERANEAARPSDSATSRVATRAIASPAREPEAATVLDGSPLEAYKRARNVGPETPARYAQSSNLIGDSRPESLAVFGRELVVTGEGLSGAAGFFFIGLPVADATDVLGVQTGDLTGDGRRELLVRVRQRIGDVQRELVYCYTLAAQRADQLLAVEVSRARGAQRIDNKVALVTDSQRAVLTIEPGVARGWSAADYPFIVESVDGVAPLLLPWKDHTTSYVFERDHLVPKVRTNN